MSEPLARTASGARPFTVACVPTGMKAGVATAPCGVVISPRRAAPSVAMRRKAKGSGIGDRINLTGSILRLEQEAGVAIGVEPISRFDRVRIGAFHHVQAGEGR